MSLSKELRRRLAGIKSSYDASLRGGEEKTAWLEYEGKELSVERSLERDGSRRGERKVVLLSFAIFCCGSRSMLFWSIVVLEGPGEEASSAANKELSFWTKDWV